MICVCAYNSNSSPWEVLYSAAEPLTAVCTIVSQVFCLMRASTYDHCTLSWLLQELSTKANAVPSQYLYRNFTPRWFLCCAGTQTQQSAGEPPSKSEQRSQSATAPQDPEAAPGPAPGESQPSNPPAEAEANGDKPEHQHHGIATVTDVAAVSSVVGANQPMADEAPADEAADVAPADQAMTTKAEPGDPVSAPGTVDVASAAAAAEAAVVDVPTHLTDEERRLLDWHWANLEYGCSARLSQVSTVASASLATIATSVVMAIVKVALVASSPARLLACPQSMLYALSACHLVLWPSWSKYSRKHIQCRYH